MNYNEKETTIRLFYGISIQFFPTLPISSLSFLFFMLFFFLCVSVSLRRCVCLSVRLSICLCLCLSLFRFLSLCLSLPLRLPVSTYLSVCLSVCLCVLVRLSVCLYLCLSLSMKQVPRGYATTSTSLIVSLIMMSFDNFLPSETAILLVRK